jgi:hypothetical protein
MVDCDGSTMGAVAVSVSSSSTTDSQSLSSAFSFSPNIEFVLRKRTVLAGRRCLNVVVFGAGLLTSRMVSSSTSPTSVNIDRRRLCAGWGRTRSMLSPSRNESDRQWSRVGRVLRVVQSSMVRKAEKKGGERYGGMDDVEA